MPNQTQVRIMAIGEFNAAISKMNKVFYKIIGGKGHGTMAQLKLGIAPLVAELTKEIVTLKVEEKYQDLLETWPDVLGITEIIGKNEINARILQAQNAVNSIREQYSEHLQYKSVSEKLRKAERHLEEAFNINNEVYETFVFE